MAKTRFIQSNFVSGELSPLLKGRTDLEQYYQGVEQASDVVIVPQGGLKRRPGTQHIGIVPNTLERNTTTPTMPNGGTSSTINDGSDSTSTSTTTNISTTNNYKVAQYDLGAATDVEFIDIRGVKLTSGTSDEFRVTYSDNGSTWSVGATVPALTTTEQNFRLYVGTSHRYWAFERIGTTDLGSAKVTLAEMNVIEQTATTSPCKLFNFSVEADRHYLMALTAGNIRCYRTPTDHVFDIKVDYSSDTVDAVRYIQTENVMLLVHEDYSPQRIINSGSDTAWSIGDIPFSNVPQFDYNDSLSPTPTSDVQTLTFSSFTAGDTYQVDIEGVLSKNITYAGDSTSDQQSSTAFNLQKNIQEMPVMGDTGVTVTRIGTNAYRITVGGESAKNFELYSGFPTSGTASKSLSFAKTTDGSPRKEDVWSAARGYPRTACFYDGRLIFGGTKSKPQSLIASKAGDFFNFDTGEGDDDEAIFITITSRGLNEIVSIFPGRNLQVFSVDGEFAVLARPITPATIDVIPQTSHGSVSIDAKEVDGATLFADKNGKTIREFVYSFNEDAYTSLDKSVLSSHLISSPVNMSILSGTSSDDANWVFIVNSDGNAAVLNTLRSQDINGFTKWSTAGFITNAVVVYDQLYMVNKRTVDGSTRYHVERWSFDHLTDNSVKKAVGATVSGLEHLEGETVSVIADGSVLPSRAVSGGSITLSDSEQDHTEVEIGINFIPTVKPMPLNTNIGSGQNAMRIKRIVRMNVRVYESFGVYIEGFETPIRSFGDSSVSPLGSAPQAVSGIIEDVLSAIGWARDSMPTFSANDPTPFHLQQIEYEIESS